MSPKAPPNRVDPFYAPVFVGYTIRPRQAYRDAEEKSVLPVSALTHELATAALLVVMPGVKTDTKFFSFPTDAELNYVQNKALANQLALFGVPAGLNGGPSHLIGFQPQLFLRMLGVSLAGEQQRTKAQAENAATLLVPAFWQYPHAIDIWDSLRPLSHEGASQEEIWAAVSEQFLPSDHRVAFADRVEATDVGTLLILHARLNIVDAS